jgi:NitT/TauT family transport system substrate-binding protein
VVQCFVDGSAKGWYNYLYGDSSKADARIKADNPDITDEQLAFARKQLMAYGIVDSGDALEKGIGVMTKDRIDTFFSAMAKAGAISPDLDYSSAYTLQFVGKGVGMDLKK